MGLGREEGKPALHISKVKPGEPWRSKASASIFGSKHTSSSPPSDSSMSRGPSSCLPQGVRKFTGAGTHSQGPAPSPFRSSPQFFRSKFRLVSQRLISQTLNLSATSWPPNPSTPEPRRPAPILAGQPAHQHDHAPGAKDDATGGQLRPTAQERRHGGEREEPLEAERGAEAARGKPGDTGDRELDSGTCAEPSGGGVALGVDHSEGGHWKRALRHAAGRASGGASGVGIQSSNSTSPL